MVGYLEGTIETEDDLGSRVLRKPMSSLQSNSHGKETFIFQPILKSSVLLERI